MSRPQKYSHTEIVSAGLAIKRDGTQVTGYRLQKHLGGGNPDNLIRKWRAHAAPGHICPAVEAELPYELIHAMESLMDAIREQVEPVLRNYCKTLKEAAECSIEDPASTTNERYEAVADEVRDVRHDLNHLEDRVGTIEEDLQRAPNRSAFLARTLSDFAGGRISASDLEAAIEDDETGHDQQQASAGELPDDQEPALKSEPSNRVDWLLDPDDGIPF